MEEMRIEGASIAVNRAFASCGPWQWVRETYVNSRESGATQVEFGIEWQAVKKLKKYRMMISDNGCGMDQTELRKFFSTLNCGGKKIGGLHDNFGVGAKISLVPWNTEGVVVISYKNKVGYMIWIRSDDDGRYCLQDVEDKDGSLRTVYPPFNDVDEGIDWRSVAPSWSKDHGTVIILLGSEEFPNTVLGNQESPGEGTVRGITRYLNTRFWDLTENMNVVVEELQSTKSGQWPSEPGTDLSKRRQAYGAKRFLLNPPKSKDLSKDTQYKVKHGNLALSNSRVNASWYLANFRANSIHVVAQEAGYIAVVYKDELYEISNNKKDFVAFGIAEGEVQKNLTILLTPKHSAGKNDWGVYPSESRNSLLFTGDHEKGARVPLVDWGLEFASKLPEEILDAIKAVRVDINVELDDDHRKRLQDRFGARWRIPKVVRSRNDQGQKAGDPTGKLVDLLSEDLDGKEFPTRHNNNNPASRKPRRTKILKDAAEEVLADSESAVSDTVESPVDIPRVEFKHKDSFPEPWHMAMYASKVTAVREYPTIFINMDSEILLESIKYYQSRYADVYAEEVKQTVLKIFGEVAIGKIAHTQQLSKFIDVSTLDEKYRTPEALTTALMGLVSEDVLITRVLGGKFGKKIE